MEIPDIVVFGALIVVAWALPAGLVWYLLGRKVQIHAASLKEAGERLQALETWVKEEEEAALEAEKEEEKAQSAKFSELGQRSAEVRQERKARETEAYNEAIPLVRQAQAGGDIEQIKASIRQVVEKYPDVAENTAKKLIRDMKLQRYEGMIIPLVSQWAAAALAPRAPPTPDFQSGW